APQAVADRRGKEAAGPETIGPHPVLASTRPLGPGEADDDSTASASDAPPHGDLEGRASAPAVQEVFYGDRSRRWVALTFDDGPSRENTPRVLDVLRRHDVRATFFVLGHRAEDMPDL